MSVELSSFEDLVNDLSEKYNVPFEIVEAILIDWIEILYETMRPHPNPSIFESI